MEKYVSLGFEEEIIECDIDITYKDFLSKIQSIFKLKNDTFSINDLTEDNFDEMMTIKDNFNIVRAEKDLSKERLVDIASFADISTVQEAEDFFLVYGYIEDEHGATPLHTSAYHGKIELVKLIIEKNFYDVHRADIYGRTPLYWAALEGHTNIVKLLLEQNFDNAHQANESNSTPLYEAARLGETDIVRLLLEKNFDNAHQKNNYHETPLEVTEYSFYPEIRELLEKDIERREKYQSNKEFTCNCLCM